MTKYTIFEAAPKNEPILSYILHIIPPNITKNEIKIAFFLPFASETIFITNRPAKEPKLKID